MHRIKVMSWRWTCLALFIGAALLSFGSAPPAGAAEIYLPLDRIKVGFTDGNTFQGSLVVDITLALHTGADQEHLRTVRHAIKAEIATALSQKSFQHYQGGNLAEKVKRLARPAAQQAGGAAVKDTLIRNVGLR